MFIEQKKHERSYSLLFWRWSPWLGWLVAALLLTWLAVRPATIARQVLGAQGAAPVVGPVTAAQGAKQVSAKPLPHSRVQSPRLAATLRAYDALGQSAWPQKGTSFVATSPVGLRTLLANADRSADAASQHAAYLALSDCAVRLADWPVEQLALADTAPTPASRAAQELIARCDGLPIDTVVRKASELRAGMLAASVPAAIAESLADRYRGGATLADVVVADQLRFGADANTLEPLKAFYDALNRDEPRIVEPVPYKHRAAAAVAWQLAWCELGRDCSANHREWLELCASRSVCGVASPNDYALALLPETEVQRAFVYRDMILRSLAVGDFEAVGLAANPRVRHMLRAH